MISVCVGLNGPKNLKHPRKYHYRIWSETLWCYSFMAVFLSIITLKTETKIGNIWNKTSSMDPLTTAQLHFNLIFLLLERRKEEGSSDLQRKVRSRTYIYCNQRR